MRHTTTGVANERPSRVSRVAVILSTLGVALIAAWVFVPMLLASHTATVPAPKPRTVAQQPVIAPPPAPVVTTKVVAPPREEATASVTPPERLDPPSLAPWPADPAPEAPADTGATRMAATPPAEPGEFVPLPRKRPRLAIAGRQIPMPRPRPEAETDAPAAEQSAFERQVDRMR